MFVGRTLYQQVLLDAVGRQGQLLERHPCLYSEEAANCLLEIVTWILPDRPPRLVAVLEEYRQIPARQRVTRRGLVDRLQSCLDEAIALELPPQPASASA